MDWRFKAFLQGLFSRLPHGEELNCLCQRYVTRGLPASEPEFLERCAIARRHIEIASRYGEQPLGGRRFYEFGAGRDLVGPLTFHALGVERQVLIDLYRLVRPGLINDTIGKFQRLGPGLGLKRIPRARVGDGEGAALRDLGRHYGIEYLAPKDARQTGFEAGSVDSITSTNTLEHIPAADLPAILRECRRLLRDDGAITAFIDYQDHYSYFDRSISVYNFLRYPERAWRKFNPALHYQNRLRHRDYLELFQAGGFHITEQHRVEGIEEDLKTLQRVGVDEKFQGYSPAECAVRKALIVARRA
jgi:SAM-dependent methyltransferase